MLPDGLAIHLSHGRGIMSAMLDDAVLPEGFRYPRAFERLLSCGLVNLEPWHVLSGDRLLWQLNGLQSRYPSQLAIPFAYRQDNDDVACFDAVRAEAVVVIHDFASAGHEVEAEFESFEAWLRAAFDDYLDWES